MKKFFLVLLTLATTFLSVQTVFASNANSAISLPNDGGGEPIDLEKADFSKFKTTLIFFSDNTFVITQDDIRTFLKNNLQQKTKPSVIPMQLTPVTRIPKGYKLVSVNSGKFERTPLPATLYNPENPGDQPIVVCEDDTFYVCYLDYTNGHFSISLCGCFGRNDEAETPKVELEIRDWMKDFL